MVNTPLRLPFRRLQLANFMRNTATLATHGAGSATLFSVYVVTRLSFEDRWGNEKYSFTHNMMPQLQKNCFPPGLSL
jgi:hypothetical protein